MKKSWIPIVLLMILSGILTACTNPIKKENIHTPMSAAKAFVTALTSNNMIQLNQVVYGSQSMPTEEIMSIAKMRKITTMSPEQFFYKVDPKDKNKQTVDVSFKDENGIKDTWKLVFVQNEAGNYQYDGNLSGTLLANTSTNEALQSYSEILIHSADKYWEKDISLQRMPELIIEPDMIRFVQTYHLNRKTVNDFSVGKILYSDENKVRALLQFKDDKSNIHNIICNFARQDDGLYIDGAWEGETGRFDTPKAYQAKTPAKATMAFMNALYNGGMDPAQLVQPKLAIDISTIAQVRKIAGMKWGYDYELDPKTYGEVHISFRSPTGGGTDNYEFIFKKNKAGIEQFDTNASGTLLENMTPERTAQSYVNALIHNANAYQLKSLILPFNRSGYSNKDASNLVTKYQLQKKKLSDFKITAANNQVTIQFTDSAGNSHSIHLTTEKWKDGYYVVAEQVK